MHAKKKGQPARNGRPLDDVRPGKVAPVLCAHIGHPKQEPNRFGRKLSTGAREAPFSCALGNEICTHGIEGIPSRQVAVLIGKKGLPRRAPAATRSYLVTRHHLHQAPRRTASPQGLTVAELRRMARAAQFLSDRKWRLVHVTVAGHHLAPRDFDAMLRKLKSRITDAQRRGKMRTGMYVDVRETSCSTHSHLIVAGTPAALRAIRRLGGAFGLDVDGNAFVKITTVYDVDGLVEYLSWEANAWACTMLDRTYHRHASRAIGDRVRLGSGLKAAMLAAGELEPYRKTYATPTAAKVAKRRKPAPKLDPSRGLDEPSPNEARHSPAPIPVASEQGRDVDEASGQEGFKLFVSRHQVGGIKDECGQHMRSPRLPSGWPRRRAAKSLIRSPRRRTAPLASGMKAKVTVHGMHHRVIFVPVKTTTEYMQVFV